MRKRIAAIVLSLAFAESASGVLYANDLEGRHPSTPSEQQLYFAMRSTVVLLNENTILTAKHTPNDGGAYWIDEEHSVIVEETLEASKEALGEVDYKIQKIKWLRLKVENGQKEFVPTTCPKGRKFISQISSLEDNYLKSHQGEIYVMDFKTNVYGYPIDKNGEPTTSIGDKVYFNVTAANPQIYLINFNAGVVRGNSGGPILDQEGKFVGIVTGGPGYSIHPEFDKNNIEHFNWGLSAKSLYRTSPVFKKLIDDGQTTGKAGCD